MQFVPAISAVTGLLGLFKGDKGGEQQAQAAPAAPEQAPQTQAAKSAGAATMMQKNADMEGPAVAGSTLLTSNDLGAGTLGKSKTLGG